MPIETAAPRLVRAAGVLVALQGLAGVGFAVALVVGVLMGHPHPGNLLGEAAYFAVLAAGVVTAGIGLVRGRRWARTPAVVVQLILLGIAWYMFGASGQPVVGGLLGLVSLAVLILLSSTRSRAWATDGYAR